MRVLVARAAYSWSAPVRAELMRGRVVVVNVTKHEIRFRFEKGAAGA